MNRLTKEITATWGNTILVVGLSNKDEVMYVKSTIRVKPKNRKQKKEFKSQSYRMKKVAKGEFVQYKGKELVDEEGTILPQQEFWAIRSGGSWENGWEEYKED